MLETIFSFNFLKVNILYISKLLYQLVIEVLEQVDTPKSLRYLNKLIHLNLR